MAATATLDRLSVQQLRQLIQQAEPSALLIEPRILRRVIKQDRRMGGFGLYVPHHHVYTIQRDRLLVIADRTELELSPADDLPRKVLLLARPTDGDPWEDAPADELLRIYWRLLFHGRVHYELEERRASGKLTDEQLAVRRQIIGWVEFAEVASVLSRDDQLLPPADVWETYVEFAATYWELRYFAPDHVPVYFPAIRDWTAVERILEADVEHERIFAETRLRGSAPPVRPAPTRTATVLGAARAETTPRDPLEPSPPKFWKLVARAERANRLGNGAKAVVFRMMASRVALPDRAVEMRQLALAELERLVSRLALALELPSDVQSRWVEALQPLLPQVAFDRWGPEARLLYDLQKVCIESERIPRQLNWRRWLLSAGRQPLTEELPLLRLVLITKHLRTAEHRLATLHLDVDNRQRLEKLLQDAFRRTEHQMRVSLAPRIVDAFDQVGLTPQTTVEAVARDKVVQELIDRVIERGFFHMGDLRDALASSNLKLPDIHAWKEAFTGDELLRADRLLKQTLRGVYHGGPIYLRAPQSLSSLAFGTPLGRFLTQFLILPFGGAYLILEGLRHLIHSIAHMQIETFLIPAVDSERYAAERLLEATLLAVSAPERLPLTVAASATWASWDSFQPHAPVGPTLEVWFWLFVLLLGTLFLLLIHVPASRRILAQWLIRLGQWLKLLLVDVPGFVLRSPLVQRIVQSQAYRILHHYAVRPAIFTMFILLPWWARGWQLDLSVALNVFLALDLFLNSPVGRYADERVTDILVRAWHELRLRVFAALYQWIMDLFHQVLEAVERLLYMVDEWLLFRRGDPRLSYALKLIVAPIWAVVRYIVRMCVTLLIEPQINPIKHFPVVTVSHKILLPTIPLVAAQFMFLFDKPMALTLATILVAVLPGVFGFLVWELKGNWCLYAANRSRYIPRTRIGSHGETMVGLLRPGFHSGTIPRTYSRLRRAYRRADLSGNWKGVNRYQANLQHIQEDIRKFFEREFLALLRYAGIAVGGQSGQGVALHNHTVRLATNRVDVELLVSDHPPLCLSIEECSGWLTVDIRSPGWLDQLPKDQCHVARRALEGVYQMLGVDVVREKVEEWLGLAPDSYEITSEGIQIRGIADAPHKKSIIPIRRKPQRSIAPEDVIRSDITTGQLPAYSSLRLDWQRWVELWEPYTVAASVSDSSPPQEIPAEANAG